MRTIKVTGKGQIKEEGETMNTDILHDLIDGYRSILR